MENQQIKRALIIYTIIVALAGLALGLSDNLFSNYFRDAFDVNAFQRGFIEFPRELPGVLTVVVLSTFAFLGDKKLTLVSFALSFIGIMFLALANPSYLTMLFFLFITSMGIHMFMPLYDTLGMSLAIKGDYGRILGRFNSVRTAFSLLAAGIAFVGFRTGFFSFTTPIIRIFLFAGILFAIIFCLFLYLMKLTPDTGPQKSHFVIKKKYRRFYVLAALFGGRKQIMFVFGPWVLIELFDFGPDYISLFLIISAVVSVVVLPIIGRWIDKYGAPWVMVLEVILFFVIYIGYGVISAGSSGGWMPRTALVVGILVFIYTLDRVVMNFAMARSIYLRSIVDTPDDVTPTLATGLALDHIFSIASAFICGWIWQEFGPQYVFIFSGVLALIQLIVAKGIKPNIIKSTF